MNDNDIIKALETCVNLNCCIDGCPFMFDECGAETSTEECLFKMIKCVFGLVKRYRAENERLTINMNAFGLGMKHEKERADTARAEAIKEFAERLKESISNTEYTANIKRKTVSVETLYTQVNWVFHEIVPKTIDNLMKEMTEEHNGNV